MRDIKYEVQEFVRKENDNELLEVKKVFFQDTLWGGYTEVVAITESGKAFSALYQGDMKLSKYVAIPRNVQEAK